MAVGQAEADVGRAAGGVHAQLVAQAAHKRKNLLPGRGHGTDRHDQRVDHDVMRGNAEIGRAFDDLPGHRETHVGVLADAGVIIGNGNHGHVVFLDQRQDQFQTLFLARHRVQQRAALAGAQAFFQRAGNRAVDAQWHIDQCLNAQDQLAHQRRLDKIVVSIARVAGHLVGKDRARVHVQHHGTTGDLFQRVALDGGEIARLQLCRQLLAPGRVNTLANHTKGLVKADDDGFRF